jgi:spore coat protein U-like protein
MLSRFIKTLIFSSSILALSGAMGNHQTYAGVTSASTQTTATLAASCTITAQNLNFGALTLPLSAQTASANMNVLCSKNHAYTVGLAYGGVYGQGTGYDYYIQTGYTYINNNNQYYTYNEYTPGGTLITTFNVQNSIYSNDGAPSGATQVSTTKWVSNTGTAAYAYGKMVGVAKGDSVAYSIQVPGQPGEIWNAGNSSYSATGTGSNQTIPVVGTLVPAQSGSNYPTPDSYMDTVTATVTF